MTGLALVGLRVLDVSQVMAGPCCCLLLADRVDRCARAAGLRRHTTE